MKKIVFWSLEALMLVFLIIWMLCVMHYYQIADFSFLPLPKLDYSILNGPRDNLLTTVAGFATIEQIGFTSLILGFGIAIVYSSIMLAMYSYSHISKTIIFWLNISFYSFFLISFLIGVLFINLPL